MVIFVQSWCLGMLEISCF